MARTTTRLLLSLAWPAVGIAWLAWAGWSQLFRRSRALAIVAVAALTLAAVATVQARPEQSLAVTRTALLAPFSVPAVGWGLAHGGTLRIEGNMLVVSGMDGGHGMRSTLTIGQVILTSRDDLEGGLLAHESIHGNQWAFLGALTPPLYYLSDLLGGGPEHNVFEVSAGLEDGGYSA